MRPDAEEAPVDPPSADVIAAQPHRHDSNPDDPTADPVDSPHQIPMDLDDDEAPIYTGPDLIDREPTSATSTSTSGHDTHEHAPTAETWTDIPNTNATEHAGAEIGLREADHVDDDSIAPPAQRRLPATGSGWLGVTALVGLFVLTLAQFMYFRVQTWGSIFFELGRYDMLHGLAPSGITEPLRSVYTPHPIYYVLNRWAAYLGKLVVSAIKTPAVIIFDYVGPLELVLIGAGALTLGRHGRAARVLRLAAALTLVQLVLSWGTSLDTMAWRSVTPALWIALALGADVIARRIMPDWPEAMIAGLVFLASVLPFGHAAIDAYSTPRLDAGVLTEDDARSLGDWTMAMVPAGSSVMTDHTELVWYADRSVVWLPHDPREVDEVRSLTGSMFALWREDAGAASTTEEWLRYFDGVSNDGLVRVAELRLGSGTYVLGLWNTPLGDADGDRPGGEREERMIHGVSIKELVSHPDDRGFFREVVRDTDAFFGEGFAQWSHSRMERNVVKAWHFHHQQVDWWYVPIGNVDVVLYDLREDSPTYRQKMEFQMGENNPVCTRIPPGVAHGCKVASDEAHLFYITSKIYNPDDEGRYPFNTDQIDHDWGDPDTVITSERDRCTFMPTAPCPPTEPVTSS